MNGNKTRKQSSNLHIETKKNLARLAVDEEEIEKLLLFNSINYKRRREEEATPRKRLY